jgi:hypothetical protein
VVREDGPSAAEASYLDINLSVDIVLATLYVKWLARYIVLTVWFSVII